MGGWQASIFLVVVGIFAALRLLKRPKRLAISSPTIGFLDLSGGEFADQLHSDKAMLAPLFASNEEGAGVPPKCNVLFLYFKADGEGQIQGTRQGLRDLIQTSGAPIVVVASENTGAEYRTVAKKTGYGSANLVMTLDRKGAAFGQFFHDLFSLMKAGKSMPVAWVKLAPQIPGHEHPNCPDSIFVCEMGQVSFQ